MEIGTESYRSYFALQLTSNDLKLDYVNVTIEPYGVITVSEGCPYNLQHEGEINCCDRHNFIWI